MQELDFHEVADEFIDLANEMSEEWAPAFLSAAILYAAARFNAFHFLNHQDGSNDPNDALAYLQEQYKRMFLENLNELS